MPEPALFIGVVSHEGSRFSVSQGPQGLAAALHERLPSTLVQVNTADLLDERVLPVTPALVQASLTAELHADRIWARYLGRRLGPRWWAGHGLRWAKRGWRAVQPPPLGSVHRLLNIELSHLDLMRAGLNSGAPLILVLEDDAMSADAADLAAGLAGIMRVSDSLDASTVPVGFVNLSQSFDLATLGIGQLLGPAPATWAGSAERTVLAASRPVTNTVCAILYFAPFLRALVDQFDRLPMTPVVPIDWKLNLALMAMFEAGQAGPGACWLVEPAPITQMSMQAAEILPE